MIFILFVFYWVNRPCSLFLYTVPMVGMVTAWLQHGYSMVTARLQHGYSKVTARLQHGYSTVTARLQHGYSTVTARLQHGYSTVTARLQHGYSTVTARLQHGYSTVTDWYNSKYFFIHCDSLNIWMSFCNVMVSHTDKNYAAY